MNPVRLRKVGMNQYRLWEALMNVKSVSKDLADLMFDNYDWSYYPIWDLDLINLKIEIKWSESQVVVVYHVENMQDKDKLFKYIQESIFKGVNGMEVVGDEWIRVFKLKAGFKGKWDALLMKVLIMSLTLKHYAYTLHCIPHRGIPIKPTRLDRGREEYKAYLERLAAEIEKEKQEALAKGLVKEFCGKKVTVEQFDRLEAELAVSYGNRYRGDKELSMSFHEGEDIQEDKSKVIQIRDHVLRFGGLRFVSDKDE